MDQKTQPSEIYKFLRYKQFVYVRIVIDLLTSTSHAMFI